MKKFIKNNKLTVITFIICLVFVILVFAIKLTFFPDEGRAIYGDRLDGIENYPIEDSFIDEYIANLEADEMINSVSFDVRGRIIYIDIDFVGDTSLVEAQSKAAASIEQFSEETLSYYDINFTLTSASTENSEGFTIMGARNVAGSGLVWNNNTPMESEEES